MRKLQTTNYKLQTERGATTILIAFFVMNILMMMALAAADIMIYQIQMSKEIANSVLAFYAADAGAEKCLYQARKGTPGVGCAESDNPIQISLTNGAVSQAAVTGGVKINSSGSFGGTRRSVELMQMIGSGSFICSNLPAHAAACSGTGSGLTQNRDYSLVSSCSASQTDKCQAVCGSGYTLSGGVCVVVAAPTCSDGIRNQGETGVDCGGPCGACCVPYEGQVCGTKPAYCVNACVISCGGCTEPGTWANSDGGVWHCAGSGSWDCSPQTVNMYYQCDGSCQ